jgi:hypothetical protein
VVKRVKFEEDVPADLSKYDEFNSEAPSGQVIKEEEGNHTDLSHHEVAKVEEQETHAVKIETDSSVEMSHINEFEKSGPVTILESIEEERICRG